MAQLSATTGAGIVMSAKHLPALVLTLTVGGQVIVGFSLSFTTISKKHSPTNWV